jgi:uncharacterized protein (UPF0371 family)
MKAKIFNLGHGIGVCHFTQDEATWVAEVNMDELRVLPQSIREVKEITITTVELEEETTDQDHVDRMALAITRLRTRLADFDLTTMSRANARELQAQALALALEVRRLTGGA